MSQTVLADTHVLLWYDAAPDQLSDTVRLLLQQRTNRVLVSAISALEIAVKFRLGKLPQAAGLVERYEATLGGYDFEQLPLDSGSAMAVAGLKSSHPDPFDCVIAAQALRLGIPLVTRDAAFRSFPGLSTIW